jgi:uncharacterized membrane protein
MNTKWTIILTLILAVAVLCLGLILEPQFADPMATHWGANGEANGFGSHFVGIWLIPLMLIGINGLFLIIPKIDPLKKNIAKFRKEYNGFVLVINAFMVYVQVLTLIWNTGNHFNMTTYMLPALGFFIFYAGVLISKARRNYFVGIRTPWTLQDERVWDETHQLGAKIFKVSGVLTLVGIFFPNLILWFMMIPLLGGALFTIVYSYVLYQRYHPNNGD